MAQVPRAGIGVLLPVWLAFFLFVLPNFMLFPFLGLYALALDGSPLLVGFIYGANSLASFLTRLPGAGLADRYGTRPLIVLGMAANTLAVIVYLAVARPELLILGSALQGVGLAFFQPAMFTYLYETDTGGRSRESFVGYGTTAAAVGQSAGPSVAAALLVAAGTPPGNFRVMLAGALLASVAGGIVVARSLHPRRAGPRAEHISLWDLHQMRVIMRGEFLAAMYSRGVLSYVLGTMLSFLPLYATRALHMDERVVGLLFTFGALFNIVGRPLGSRLAARAGEIAVFQAAVGLTALSSLLVLAAGELVVLSLAMIPYGLGIGLFIPTSITFVGVRVTARHRTLGMGLVTLMLDVGFALGGLGSAALHSATGSFVPVFSAAALLGASGVAGHRLARRPIRALREATAASLDEGVAQ